MQLTETVIDSADGRYRRRLWRSPASDAPACIFLDAELYIERVGVLSVLDDMLASGSLPEMQFIFVSNEDAEARHHDYTCNADYARFIAEDILPAGRPGNLICGLSLSGLAAAHIATSYPDSFSGALCQSGSFWWERCRFLQGLLSRETLPGRFWLSVGTEEREYGVTHPPTGLLQELSQLDSVRLLERVLRERDAIVRVNEYKGGHDPAMWRAELPEALEWLLVSPAGNPH
ncbi:MAG: esterase family protein [Planctomycetales bacterium]|nr:esterase family protein [bacterium]UNM08704.1 MAG: esterase family protein [Planctomycetales bacterium]